MLDLAARKLLAMLDRLEARDYIDLRALAERVGQAVCISAALSRNAGLSAGHFAEALDRVRLLRDERFPMTPSAADDVKRYFTEWAAALSG